MKTIVKKVSETKVLLTITLDAENLAIAEQVATKKLAKDVKVAGFRKGKAPMAVVAKNINPEMLQEQILNDAISKAVAEAFLDNKIQALDRPEVEVKKYVPGEMVEFTAEAEILPEVKLGNYKKLKIKSEKIEVSDSEVNEVVDRIRQGFSEKKEVERPAVIGDETTIDFIGKKDGVAFDGGTGNDYNLTLGSKQFIPGFEEGIVGHKIGETFDLELTFPADYGSAELKGQKVTFTTTLKKIKEVVLPEMTDELAVKAGPFKTVEELKNDIKRELLGQKDREQKDKIKDELVKQLVEISEVPVPEILISDQMKSIEQDFVQNLMYQGLTIDQYIENKGFESKEKWQNEEVRQVAIKRVQAGLVLAELSRVENIQASADELTARLNEFRVQYGKNADVLKQLEQPETQRDIANRLLTEKTVDLLLELNSK